MMIYRDTFFSLNQGENVVTTIMVTCLTVINLIGNTEYLYNHNNAIVVCIYSHCTSGQTDVQDNTNSDATVNHNFRLI